LPTCIGFGSTKTLAKLANHIAKTAERKPGSYPSHFAQVFNLSELNPNERNVLMKSTEVGDIWGVGRQISKQLRGMGITNALELSQLDVSIARARWSITLERTIRELRGETCFSFEEHPEDKKQIACTRSFGQPITQRRYLEEAISEFASRAAEKLRKQNSHAGQVLAFIRTSPFRKDDKQYSRSAVVPLDSPTSDTVKIIDAALYVLHSIYKPGHNFVKAGVILLDLQPSTQPQLSLVLEDTSEKNETRERLMQTLDSVNKRYGRGTVKLASAGAQFRPWQMKQERKTPRYTTDWNGLAYVKA